MLAVVAIIAATARPAAAITVGGGGGARTDCLAVFQAPANTPASHPRSIVCADGDPTCDADGVVNGVCAIAIAVCANSTFSPMCTLAGVQSITIAHARDDGDPKFDPGMQALQQRVQSEIDPPTSATGLCTSPTTLRVPIRGPFGNGMCKPRKAVVDMVTLSTVIDGAVYRDADRLRVRCEPAPDGCTARALFSGTFDPSLLLQKLLGPPAGFGARMPFNGRPLDRALIDVVELWIAAGAPQTGWVPGTD